MNKAKRPTDRLVVAGTIPLPARPGIKALHNPDAENTILAQKARISRLAVQVAASAHLGVNGVPASRSFKRSPG